MESNHGYTIKEEVYVKPTDSDVLKGIVVGFQVIGEKLPIIECKHPYKKGEKCRRAFNLDRISKTPTIKMYEWGLVEKIYSYKK